MKLSEIYRNSCISWNAYHRGHNYLGRQRVYVYLNSHYGRQSVLRHMRQIKAALDKIEQELRGN